MMDASSKSGISLISTIWGILSRWWPSRQNKRREKQTGTVRLPEETNDTGGPVLKCTIEKGAGTPSESETEACRTYREMYFKLHHLEEYPDVIPNARGILLSLLSEAIYSAHAYEGSILAIDRFSPPTLNNFIHNEVDRVTVQWQQYLKRRKVGGPREMFRDADEAKRWLVQVAPLKYIDGSWLGHIHKTTTKFAYRHITKGAWQVLSEELGDGDLDKNHVYVYKQLMSKIGVDLPSADAEDFTHLVATDQPHVWKAAISQLLISLFPNEFLPEILGFNMHFELLTLDTMLAAKELREVNIDPYYFLLHITIDNGDTGHTRLAVETVIKYLTFVQSTEGDVAAHRAWRRVQAGYTLSKFLPSDKFCNDIDLPLNMRGPFVKDVIEIFQAKSTAANRLHDDCPARIGGKAINVWLEPETFKNSEWQLEFLTCLSKARPWVYKGNSDRSKLVQQMLWGGRMFGAFTHSEVMTIRNWIDSLDSKSHQHYWYFTFQTPNTLASASGKSNIRVDYPASTADLLNEATGLLHQLPHFTGGTAYHLAVDVDQGFVTEKLFPLWFAHPCLLESFICIPWMTTTQIGNAIVRFLRAQHGFEPETPGVAGMDEVRRTGNVGLVEIGWEMIENAGHAKPADLAEVLDRWPSQFAEMILSLSLRPRRYGWLLLGLAQAFVHLHITLTRSSLLSPQSRAALYHICSREQDSLNVCIEELRRIEAQYEDFQRGYALAKVEIEGCFDSSVPMHG